MLLFYRRLKLLHPLISMFQGMLFLPLHKVTEIVLQPVKVWKIEFLKISLIQVLAVSWWFGINFKCISVRNSIHISINWEILWNDKAIKKTWLFIALARTQLLLAENWQTWRKSFLSTFSTLCSINGMRSIIVFGITLLLSITRTTLFVMLAAKHLDKCGNGSAFFSLQFRNVL